MTPGAHVAVLADRAEVGIEGRLLGLELRDTLLVLRPGPTAGFVFLFRAPISEPTLAAQVLTTGTGALDLDSSRVVNGAPKQEGRWPPNVLLVHAPGCRKAGFRRVPTGVAHRTRSGGRTSFRRKNGDHFKPLLPDMTYAEEDGLETATAYECESGCPAGAEMISHGGASRFYPQFLHESELVAWLGRLMGGGQVLRDYGH